MKISDYIVIFFQVGASNICVEYLLCLFSVKVSKILLD